MADANPLSTQSVAELLECCPQAASVFVRHRMACVGCDIAAFHTVAEAAAIYSLDAEQFIQELVCAAQALLAQQAPPSTRTEEPE